MPYTGLSKCSARETVHLLKVLYEHMVTGDFGVSVGPIQNCKTFMTSYSAFLDAEYTNYGDGSDYVSFQLGKLEISLNVGDCHFSKKIHSDRTFITIYDKVTNLTYWFEYVNVPLEAINEAENYDASQKQDEKGNQIMNLHKVKRIKRHSDLKEVNRLLDTGDWKIADIGFDDEGNKVYELHKLK